MTAPATPDTAQYVLTEEADRITASTVDGIELCGAYQPAGHVHWSVYVTVRMTNHQHHVLATTAQVAREHVVLLAELFVRAEQ